MPLVQKIAFVFLLMVYCPLIHAQGTHDTTKTQRRQLAENEGIVKFFVNVENGYFEVLVNDTMLVRRFKDTLPEGNYYAKVWSPGYLTVPFEFTVERGKTTEKIIEMAHNNEWQDFENDYKAYRRKFHKSLSVPACITLATALTSGAFMLKAYDLQKLIHNDIDLYSQATVASQVNEIKDRVEKNNRNYNILRTSFYVGSGVTLFMLGTTIWSYSHFKKNNQEPVFKPNRPWADKFSMQVSPFGCRIQWKLG